MAVMSRAVTVTTTATRLDTDTDYADRSVGSSFGAKNVSSVTVYVGGADVTTAEGYPVEPGEPITYDLGPRDEVYGIVTSGTAAVRVTESGVGSG